MEADLERRHRDGLLRAGGVRGADYMGPGVTGAHIPIAAKRAVASKSTRVFRRPRTALDDRHCATWRSHWSPSPPSRRRKGRVWHAPTNPARSQAEDPRRRLPGDRPAAGAGAVLAGCDAPAWAGSSLPLLREMRETVYQFQRPYVLDSTAITGPSGSRRPVGQRWPGDR